MRIRAEHGINFKIEGEPKTYIPPIDDPIYIYKETDEVVVHPIEEEAKPTTFIVTKIEHFLYDVGMGEQGLVMHVRRKK